MADGFSGEFVNLQRVCTEFVNGNTLMEADLTKEFPDTLNGKVYGRICSSPSPATPPDALSSSKHKKVVFTFGYDGLLSILQQNTAFDALMKLGFSKEYITFDVNQMGYGSWLVVFLPSKAKNPFSVHPATWDGVYNTIEEHYPRLLMEFKHHFPELKQRSYREFEKDAKFEFIECLKAFKTGDPNGRPYFDYEYTCSLPRPLASWQLRAFLYCELRLLEMFDGNGRTRMESTNELGPKEYFCPLIPFSNFDHENMFMMSLNVVVPP